MPYLHHLIARTIDQSSQFYPDHCATAHETWFAAGIKRIFVQIRNACLCTEFPDQSRFSMKGRIMLCIDLIFITEHSLSVFYQHCSKGFIPMLHCQFGEFNRFFHKYFILHRITHLYPASDSSYAANLHFRSLHQSYTFSPYVCSLSTSLCFRFILQYFFAIIQYILVVFTKLFKYLQPLSRLQDSTPHAEHYISQVHYEVISCDIQKLPPGLFQSAVIFIFCYSDFMISRLSLP